MRTTSGQGTVEYVGVLLVIAVLMCAVLGGVGVPRIAAGLASSIVQGALQGIGVGGSGAAGADDHPNAVDQAAFDRAVDPSVDPVDRPSLRDVRLGLIDRHGDARGRLIYGRLVLEDLRRAVPGLAGPTLFATETSRPGWPGSEAIVGQHWLERPSGSDPGEIETPSGALNAHVVTVSEADAALAHALHPGTSWGSVMFDLITAVPVIGGAGRVALTVSRVAGALGKAATLSSLAHDASHVLAASANESPPGLREGDEVVSWSATRPGIAGAAPRRFTRIAVVRDGSVIEQGARDVTPAATGPWQ